MTSRAPLVFGADGLPQQLQSGDSLRVPWVVKTGAYNAAAGDAILANTSGGAFTVTLPSAPNIGDEIYVADASGWATNNLTVSPNGGSIEGASASMVFSVNGMSAMFAYDGATWQMFCAVSASPSTALPSAGVSAALRAFTVLI